MHYFTKYFDLPEDKEMDLMVKHAIEQTMAGTVKWECTEYNHLSILHDEYEIPETAAVSHFFEAKAAIDNHVVFLTLMESITFPSGKGDISGSISVDDLSSKHDFALSFDADDYEECDAAQVCEHYADTEIARLANAVVPQLVDSEEVQFAYTYARFYPGDVPDKFKRMPLIRLCKRILEEKRVIDFHRMILNMEAREQLMEGTKK